MKEKTATYLTLGIIGIAIAYMVVKHLPAIPAMNNINEQLKT